MPQANLSCPYCKFVQKVEIPQTGCLAFHVCEKCGEMIAVPKESDNCCVVCEYSDKKCPVHVVHTEKQKNKKT